MEHSAGHCTPRWLPRNVCTRSLAIRQVPHLMNFISTVHHEHN